MKKELFVVAFTLCNIASLVAETDIKQVNKPYLSSNCAECCCTPCCCRPQPSCAPEPTCEPCCVPEPKPCINCECYAPAFYDLQCAWGISLDVEFLYWYARETNLCYALKVNQQPKTPGSASVYFGPNTYEYLDTKWDPGVRVGLGWNSDCDGWDTNLTWTWMKNRRSSSTSVPEFSTNLASHQEFVLINPWINQAFQEVGIVLFDEVSAKWRLTFNQIDWEIGRKYWNSRCFTLRPYIALRGAWWKTNFNMSSTRNHPGEAGFAISKDSFTNRVWGVGFVGGLEPTWYFCSNFALYGNFDMALLWGRFEAKKTELIIVENLPNGVLSVDYRNASKGDFYQMSAMLDTGIGLRWEETWCCERFRTALDLGWEHHILFDQNHRMKTFDSFQTSTVNTVSTFRTFDEVTGNIGMGGLVLRLRFDF